MEGAGWQEARAPRRRSRAALIVAPGTVDRVSIRRGVVRSVLNMFLGRVSPFQFGLIC